MPSDGVRISVVCWLPHSWWQFWELPVCSGLSKIGKNTDYSFWNKTYTELFLK